MCLIQSWFLLLVLFMPAVVTAFDEVDTAAIYDVLPLDRHLQLLEDPQRRLTVEDVLKLDSGQFVSFDDRHTSIGYSASSYWAWVKLLNSSHQDSEYWLEVSAPLLDRVEIHLVRENGQIVSHLSGDQQPFQDRYLDHRFFTFPVTLAAGEHAQLFVRLESEGSIQIPIKLWTSKALLESVDQNNFMLGLYYGFGFFLTLSSLVLFLFLREKIFGFYFLYLLSFQLLQLTLNGFAQEYAWDVWPWWSNRSPPVMAALTVILMAQFTRVFLEVPRFLPRYNNMMVALMIWASAVVLLGLFGDYALASQLSAATGLLVTVLILPAAIMVLGQGYQPARYFLMGWTAFLLGVTVTAMVYLGWIPNNVFAINAMQIGSTLEIILLTMAMADRIRLFEQEERRELEIGKQELAEQRDHLEQQVSDRTRELEQQNRVLQKLASHDGLTGLLNHRAFIERMTQAYNEARRYKHPLAVIMMDLDHFKRLNDRFGHQLGDEVLAQVGKAMMSTVREADLCGRYGGEEFIIALPMTNQDEAVELGMRVLHQIRSIDLQSLQGEEITASMGLTVFDPDGPRVNIGALIQKADKALYVAKQRGRNRLVLDEDAGNSVLSIKDRM